MASHLQVEENLPRVDPSTSAVSTKCQQLSLSKSKLSYIESFTDLQWALQRSLTSPALSDTQQASNRLDVENHNTALNSASLPFAHTVPPMAFLAPVSCQESVNPPQLAGQVPFNPASSHRNSKPYTQIDCPQLTQVTRAPIMPLDDSLTWAGALDLSPHFDHPVNCTALEMSAPVLRPRIRGARSAVGLSHNHATYPPIYNRHIGFPSPTPNAGPSAQRVSPLLKGRCYDRPGKKPGVDLEPDAIKLNDKICKQRGGNNFATNWILTVFKYGVSVDVLHRILTSQEIIEMKFTGGFEPQQAYDGFIAKVGDHYECGLCKEDKKTYWKAKKNAPRHLRKFHFGLADICEVCRKRLYSKGEMRSHACKANTTAACATNKAG